MEDVLFTVTLGARIPLVRSFGALLEGEGLLLGVNILRPGVLDLWRRLSGGDSE
jgi:hypothetical protein